MTTRKPPIAAPSRPPWSVQMADSVLRRRVPPRWHYEDGLVLHALLQLWQITGEPGYFEYVKGAIDGLVDASGAIDAYTVDEYNLDQINPGKVLFPLYRATGDDRYRKAAYLLREQLRTQPRTSEGGFWHKRIYPFQMWLDGIYMASPFYAEFGRTFDEPGAFDDVVTQITLIERHTRDPRTGLLYHGWDESRQQTWANPETGCSPNFWGRAVGWYVMGTVDVLDFIPEDHPNRGRVREILCLTVAALAKVQDPATGVWFQVLDRGGEEGNYLEASASCMFVYAIAKGVRRGYLAPDYLDVAKRGYRGIHGNFIEVDGQGLANVNGICAVAGLGGIPYRDGSYAYYVGERIATNDYKGVGPFILASIEIEQLTGGRHGESNV